MADTILKRWNGTAFEELYPKTTVTQISASGTPSSSTFLRGDGQWATPAGGGTVTSVTGTAPIASSGGNTPAISLAASYGDTQNPYASKTANFVLAAPNGTAGVPTFRAVVAADITSGTLSADRVPTLDIATKTSGTLLVGRGGTGTTTAPTAGGIIWATSTSAYASTALGTSGQFLQSAGTGTPTWQNLTTNITTITNLAPNTYSSSFSVSGYRWVRITGFRNSAGTEVVFQTIVDLNDTNQWSTTARTRRIVWNNDTSTFGDDLTIQNSTGLRLQFAAGVNFNYRLDGMR